MNDRLYAGALIDEIRSAGSVVIYGDGKYGSNLATIIKKMGIFVKCFLVSKKTFGKAELMGIPIVLPLDSSRSWMEKRICGLNDEYMQKAIKILI